MTPNSLIQPQNEQIQYHNALIHLNYHKMFNYLASSKFCECIMGNTNGEMRDRHLSKKQQCTLLIFQTWVIWGIEKYKSKAFHGWNKQCHENAKSLHMSIIVLGDEYHIKLPKILLFICCLFVGQPDQLSYQKETNRQAWFEAVL